MTQTAQNVGEITVRRAKPSNLGQNEIAGIAESVAEHFNYTTDFDIHAVIDRLGGKVEVKEFWGNSSSTGALYVADVGNFKISVPLHTSIERDNFTIAHELGHYVLHYLMAPSGTTASEMTADRYGQGPEETEANWFAAAFLMPSADFKKSFKEKHGNLYELARLFCVSKQAAEIRARSLGLLNGQKPT